MNKTTLIVGDSIIKHIDGWRLNERMRSTVSVRKIAVATTKSIIHHVKGCLEDTTPDFIILHYGANNLKGNSTSKASEGITNKILNLAASVKTSKNQIFVSGVAIKYDELNKKGNEILTDW